jgi:hypothetical protein
MAVGQNVEKSIRVKKIHKSLEKPGVRIKGPTKGCPFMIPSTA